ncbi:kinase-like protein, partial [Paxillus ammoniavirescens]
VHSFPVIHGDLSSANVLLNGDGEPCLSDFGLCTVIGGLGGDVLLDQSEPPRPGAIRWVAPELISGAPDVARLSTLYDIFSFGCIMFQVSRCKQ